MTWRQLNTIFKVASLFADTNTLVKLRSVKYCLLDMAFGKVARWRNDLARTDPVFRRRRPVHQLGQRRRRFWTSGRSRQALFKPLPRIKLQWRLFLGPMLGNFLRPYFTIARNKLEYLPLASSSSLVWVRPEPTLVKVPFRWSTPWKASGFYNINKFYNFGPLCQCYETFYGRNLRMFVIS